MATLKHTDLQAEFTDKDWIATLIKNHLNNGEGGADKKVEEVSLGSMSGEGGNSGAEMRRLTVRFEDGSVDTFILKNIDPIERRLQRSQQLGLPRECNFYEELGPKLRGAGLASGLPFTLYSHGNMANGEKVILMEDLSSAVQSGFLFGTTSPLNRNKDLNSYTAQANGGQSDDPIVTTEYISTRAFETAARFHAAYWKDSSLLEHDWLRGSDWFQGSGKEAWETSQELARCNWEKMKATGFDGGELKWNQTVIDVVDASVRKTSWEDYQSFIKSHPFTLVHGDFHPGNFMWKAPSTVGGDDGTLVCVDWELVGVGCGAQDLGQCVISHMEPALRRKIEDKLLHRYYDVLIENGVSSDEYSFKACTWDYVQGGIGRWTWLLAVLCTSFGMPPYFIQVFIDQMTEFINDHGITADNVGMPRV
eukprot:TRINITY_DN9307_c0_g1_i1.p1 TRINITY_DN9307_c0_g1~~TRINITY_DN9307_c0_g1_i1.p1  ORF type:complete len:421 (+),score=74.07 TRINITY_DN9307_c0_g1_i1:156-1418(+)